MLAELTEAKYAMHTRQTALIEWLNTIISDTPFTVTLLAGDASFRRYFRLHQNGESRVIMDAPPEKEDIAPFIQIANRLAKQGIHTPTIYAVDYEQGFVLLEDLGDDLLLHVITQENADKLYTQAMNTLTTLQRTPTTNPQLPLFDHAFMLTELAVFHEWFLKAYLALELTEEETSLIARTFDALATQISQQPSVFIHRDYHSRNLIVLNNEMGVIDFQDAMQGPFTYDLVSLLKDCYVQWPHEQLMRWLALFHANLPTELHMTFPEFNRAFDLCGLQRHLKVLGVFCRLHLRDKKPAYLKDLPLTFHYTMACLERYEEFKPFYQFMQQRVQPCFLNASSS